MGIVIGCGEGPMGVSDEKGQLSPVCVLDYRQVPTCCVPLYSLAILQGIAISLSKAGNLGSVRLHIRTLLRFQQAVVLWWSVGGYEVLRKGGHVKHLPPDGS